VLMNIGVGFYETQEDKLDKLWWPLSWFVWLVTLPGSHTSFQSSASTNRLSYESLVVYSKRQNTSQASTAISHTSENSRFIKHF